MWLERGWDNKFVDLMQQFGNFRKSIGNLYFLQKF